MLETKTICIYCGSSFGKNPIYKNIAYQIGKEIGKRSLNLVYGGGTKGLMGTVALATKVFQGKVIGIIPEFLISKESDQNVAIEFDEFIVTENMHQRKLKMFEKADAFIILPGGIGTLEEFIEMLTWAQLKQHEKPIILLNVNNYWESLLNLFSKMENEGFLNNLSTIDFKIVEKIEDVFLALNL